MSGGLFMKQKKCFAILLLCALTAFHILWDRQFSSTDSSDFVPVLPEPVIQINADTKSTYFTRLLCLPDGCRFPSHSI